MRIYVYFSCVLQVYACGPPLPSSYIVCIVRMPSEASMRAAPRFQVAGVYS